MAYLEGASVHAFERLARELEAHGAPSRLRRAALRAAREEVGHARVATSLASKTGARMRKPRVAARSPVRSLVAMALENAVEGCVNETFGAAVAMVQSITARDARIRGALRPIASDEMRHAELAWSVAEWVETRLSAPERGRVKRARTRAVRALMSNAACEIERELVDELGLPDARVALSLVRDLATSLWRVC
jgi:hypothetical protein